MSDEPKFDQGPNLTLRSWRFWILLSAGSAFVTLALFAHTAWMMMMQWYGSQTSGHGFLVLPISLYLVWLERDEISRYVPRPFPPALAILAALAALWLLARLALAPVGEEFALVAMFPALVWLLLGTRIVRRLLFPLLFLFFMVPLGDSLVPSLQAIAVRIAGIGLKLVRVPFVLDGRLISVPSGKWLVAQECSGLCYVIAAVMLGCLFAKVMYRSRLRQLLFVIFSLAFSVVANGVRVSGIIIIGQLVNMRVASGVDHLIYGWILFTFIVAVLFSVGWRWREPGRTEPVKQAPLIPTSEAAAIADGRSHWRNDGRKLTPSAFLGPSLAAVTLLVFASTSISARLLDRASQAPSSLLRPAPVVSPPWLPSSDYPGTWQPQFNGADSQAVETYSDGARRVYLFVAYYTQERAAAPLVSDTNALVNPGWLIIEDGRRRSAATEPVGVAETVIQSAGKRRLVWSWYWVDGEFTDNPYRAKFQRVRALLLDGPRASAFLAMAADYAPDRSAAEQSLQEFLAHAHFRAGLLQASR